MKITLAFFAKTWYNSKIITEKGDKMDKTKVGKLLCYILRHDPQTVGLTLDEEGYLPIDDLLFGISKFKEISLNFQELEEIVGTDSKKRYSFDENKQRIRANQGHSIPVDLGLTCKVPPKYLFHGTGQKYITAIEKEGLIRKNRLHVHLSSDVITAVSVGKRHGKVVVFRINTEKMLDKGATFYQSSNGVWLIDAVPFHFLEYFPLPDYE